MVSLTTPGLLKTITYDDGKQNPGHQQSNQYFAIYSFFARPYRSRDEGNIKQCIVFVRRFLFKKTEFALI